MTWVAANIRWIMLVAGALTCTMIYAAIAPQAALRSTFGEALEGPVAEIVVDSGCHCGRSALDWVMDLGSVKQVPRQP